MIRGNALLRLFAVPVAALILGFASVGLAIQQQGRAVDSLRALALLRQEVATGPAGQADRLLVKGASVGLAQSAPQALVIDHLAAVGLTPDRLDPAPAEVGTPLTRLPLSLAFAGTEQQVMAALVALDTAEPLLRIDHVSMDGQGVEGGIVQADVALSAMAAGVAP